MRTHRIHTTEALEVGLETTLDGQAAHYLARVLRLPENSEIVVFNGDGHDYHCRLTGFGPGRVRAQVLEQAPKPSETPLRITLSQAMSRGERMEYSLQKSTELGVAVVQLLTSERVELKLSGGRLEKRMAHWRGVLVSASEQSGRATVPELRAPISLADWVTQPGDRVFLDARATLSPGALKLAQAIDVAVGPEGGFSERECDNLLKGGAQGLCLGPRILRTETAGPAAIAVFQSIAGDLG
jgi:16S rRNA (uracil1498-N3)-methyltransferase